MASDANIILKFHEDIDNVGVEIQQLTSRAVKG